MDELAAAPAVLAMDVESEAEEDEQLGAMADESGDQIGQRSVEEPSAEDKENLPDVPAGGDVGAAILKVSPDTLTLHCSLRAPPFT